MNPFTEFHERYFGLRSGLEKRFGITLAEGIPAMLEEAPVVVNNLLMAGIGMATLYLRMGAVIQMCEKLKADGDDTSFLKSISDNLFMKPPSDGNWLSIWKCSMQPAGKWEKALGQKKWEDTLKNFVNFRNKFVHDEGIVSMEKAPQLKVGLESIESIASVHDLLSQLRILKIGEEVQFRTVEGEILDLHPYVRLNSNSFPEYGVGVLPFLFQGADRRGVRFIGTDGSEVELEKDDSIETEFMRIKKVITSFGGDKAFDHSGKIGGYTDWFIGRECEIKDIFGWLNEPEGVKPVLPIYSAAGIGKGALMASIIGRLSEDGTRHLYHFCGSGIANNLQAVLYHFILQGERQRYWKDGKAINRELQGRITQLPSQYADAITLFQALLKMEISDRMVEQAIGLRDPNERFKAIAVILRELADEGKNDRIDGLLEKISETAESLKHGIHGLNEAYFSQLCEIHYKMMRSGRDSGLLAIVPEQYRSNQSKPQKPLVILIDGLDEAAVADPKRHISDWFHIHDETGRRTGRWKPPTNVRWILTYRHTEGMTESGYRFEWDGLDTMRLESIQPLRGLTVDAVRKALTGRGLTEEFMDAIMEKGSVA
jgi:hypothetical protein